MLHGVPLDPFLRAGARREPRAATPRCLRQTTRRTPLPRLLWSSVSVELGAQPPRPCPSSVPVGRRTLHQPPPCRSCGGRLRTGPLRRSAAHVATMVCGLWFVVCGFVVCGLWFVVVGCWLLVVGCWLLVVGCWLLVVGCWLLVVGCWLLVVGCLLLVVCCWLCVVGCVLCGGGCCRLGHCIVCVCPLHIRMQD